MIAADLTDDASRIVISAWESPYVSDPDRFTELLAAIHACDAAHGVHWSPGTPTIGSAAWRAARAPLMRELQSLFVFSQSAGVALG